MTPRIAIGFLLATAAFPQNWQIGGGLGYGWYHNGSIISPNGTAQAGIRNRFTATGVVTEDLYEHISGEVRYIYHDGDTFLQSGAVKATVQAQSHAFTYDVLFHWKDREARLRPFIAAGAGAKYYETTGPSPNPQPLPRISGLTEGAQWSFVLDVGAGAVYRVKDHVDLRVDFRDYITKFPAKLFSPVTGTTSRGIFHQFTPMIGIDYRF